MNSFKFFDAYTIRARLFPAVIACAPALAALALLISWRSFGISNMIASIGMLVLLFAIADAARARGRAIEVKINEDRGGLPSITMLRRNDQAIDGGSKDRYRKFLAAALGVNAPTPQQENNNQVEADTFYAQCGVWLRQNTRDQKKFSILFGENVTYGFRRNLLGVKIFALWLNVVVVVICVFILWRNSWGVEAPLGSKVLVVLIVAAAHAAYMLLAVNNQAVWDASRAYARELILSCEFFVAPPKKPIRKSAAPKGE